MKIIKRTFLVLCFVLFVLCLSFTNIVAKADMGNINNEEGVHPRGVYTSLKLSIDGNNGEVWAMAKNKFTLFSSTVYVVVQLYSSETYQDSYLSMYLESQNSISDLDMGETITAKAPTNGIKRYWKARMYYRIDNKDWQEEVTQTWLFNENGIIVM